MKWGTKQILTIVLSIGILGGCTSKPVEVHDTTEVKQVEKTKGEIPQKLPSYWPTEEWRTSTPEEQGMSSGKLVELFEKLEETSHPIEGLIIIRNGYIVAEHYPRIYKVDTQHPINSVTKSIMSSIVGIAIEEGVIKSIDEKILTYFPELEIENADPKKNDMTIRQFLTFTSGLDWPELDKGNSVKLWREFETTSDTTKYVLSKPILENQIGKFNYNTGESHVLSNIIQNQTGQKTSEYAEEKLFSKIGVTSATWSEAQGVSKGGYGMQMVPRDMARFGYLYLNKGEWDGEQIVPSDWVVASTSPQTETGRAGGEHYGYNFWLTKTKAGYDEYSAMGDRGQYIIVVPELNLIVIQTASAYGKLNIIEDYIYPSVISDSPVIIDHEANKRLHELTKTK